jgi:DNA-binding NarL/FixJ family response regulator
VGEGTNGVDVLEFASSREADVYILDVEMPILNGIETAERLLKRNPKFRILFLSIYDDRVLVEKALRAGAMGYTLKESSVDEIVRAIREINEGRYYIGPGIAGHLVENLITSDSTSKKTETDNSLTLRERQVLKYLCEELTLEEIGSKLKISPSTVHVHKNHIMQKLNIHSRTGLIKYAIKKNIIRL